MSTDEGSHDPERYNLTLRDVERRLGFRATQAGIERLEFDDDNPALPGKPKSVQPNLYKGDAYSAWGLIQELLQLLDLSRRDVKFWKDQAFKEAEAKQALNAKCEGLMKDIRRMQMAPGALDAHSVRDSLGTPRD